MSLNADILQIVGSILRLISNCANMEKDSVFWDCASSTFECSTWANHSFFLNLQVDAGRWLSNKIENLNACVPLGLKRLQKVWSESDGCSFKKNMWDDFFLPGLAWCKFEKYLQIATLGQILQKGWLWRQGELTSGQGECSPARIMFQ